MDFYCNADGLKSALIEAFETMEEDEAQGFDYEIGQIKGFPIRIVWEDESKSTIEMTYMRDFTYTAVSELEK